MRGARLRTDRTEAVAPEDTLALDWFFGNQRSTVQSSGDLLSGLHPPAHARDLLRVAVAAYITDRLVSRGRMADSWTRELELSVPVSSRVAWTGAQGSLVEALDFLSGDHWQVNFRDTDQARGGAQAGLAADAVCLFSGGLDSLSGAIDLLDRGKRIVLVGHYEGGLAPKRQGELAAALRREYGDDKIELRHLFLRAAAPNRLQERPLPRQRENTMRSRSLLFIAAGLAVASALGPEVPLYIPENGYIGINVPLTGSRPASLSTRTTHPYFFHRLRAAFDPIGMTNRLENPYRLMTKGEMLAASPNPALLEQLAPRSLSCAHPEAVRYARLPPGNCGYCYPCLIRRAALHAVGQDTDHYAFDIATRPELLGPGQKGASVRALIRSLAQSPSPRDVLRNGPIPDGETAKFAGMYERGRAELWQWLTAAGGGTIRARLGPAPS